jgi:hypothetical protein
MWSKWKSVHSLILYFCTSCRTVYPRRRRLRANLGSSHRSFRRPQGHRQKSNWSSEPKFGKPWSYCPQLTLHKMASPGHKPYFIYTATYVIYIYLFITFLGIAWNLSCIISGTDVLNTRTWVRLAAMLIGPVEVEWFPVTRAI